MYQHANRQDFEEARRKVLESALYIGKPTQEALTLQRGYSLRKALVTDVAQAALQHCLAIGQDVNAFRDLAGSGVGIVNSLESSLTQNKQFDLSENAKHEFNWNFWTHEERPVVTIKAQKFPYIERLGIEEAATSYLELPYRAPLLERTIVDILIALELYAFSKEMLEKPPDGLRWATRSPLQQKHALRRYLGAQFWAGLIFLGLAYLVAAYGPTVISETASGWIAGTFVVLFFLDLLVSTVFLPFAWRNQRRSKRKVRDLMIAMAHTYSELSGDGQVSTRRLREVAAHAADTGVVWPKALFLILDDNIARTGRI
jgi:hypothetical protein